MMASLMTVKASILNSINATGVTGMDGNNVDFTFRDLIAGHNEWWKMQAEGMQGNMHENKTFMLLKELRYLPNNYD